MSDFTDDTLGRYLDRQPGMREALLTDPFQHAQIELMRQMLDGADRAMADEGVPDEARRRVVNRVVWGEPDGLVDVHAQRREMQERAYAAYDYPVDEYRLSTRSADHDFQYGGDGVQRCTRCRHPHSQWAGGPCPGSPQDWGPGRYV